MSPEQIEEIEAELLLEAVYRRYGYDFRSYTRASMRRRIKALQLDSGFDRIADMIRPVLHDPAFLTRLVSRFTISVTEHFRDPPVFLAMREKVVPVLRTWPHIKIWHAGCASGEEVYSLAIVLKEEGLYDRATIYATDLNPQALETARDGIYGLDKLQDATRNYQLAGGQRSFSEYYHARYEAAAMDAGLRERMVFSTHSLAADGVFGEMHLVLCRNVLIYFNRELQDRALGLFRDSLVHGGFLCLGMKEDLQFSAANGDFQDVDRTARIFKRKALL